ncbi:MAG: aquaporin Z [Candidatus Eremiobacteraeota bacterium]|nr:aquaporin Z [Candidatus Eremiobacteraeota bacterium]
MALSKRLTAEFFGTFWLVFGGCGTALFAAAVPTLGVGYAGVALAFGLTVLTGVYALGPISGGHFNPAITLGLFTGGRFPGRDVLPYMIVQVAGAIIAAAILYTIATGKAGFTTAGGFAANGYGIHSPGGYALGAAFIAEFVLSFAFVMVVMGATDTRAPAGFAGLAIGLTLTAIHLVCIPITNTSVNPARSTGPALFAGGWALGQLWLFWVAPLLGGALAGYAYTVIFSEGVTRRRAIIEETTATITIGEPT